MKHQFTATILDVLRSLFGELAEAVFEASPLLQYLNTKTRSACRGAKARGAFANHYALYVLVEDYVTKGFLREQPSTYGTYEGARFSDLFRRQRELPFGAKLQNHALNSRLNDEFSKYFPTLGARPILRDLAQQRYWINENLLLVTVPAPAGSSTVNIAGAVLRIIDAYVEAKRSAFGAFLSACSELGGLADAAQAQAIDFVFRQLAPNVDARVFEIVAYAILKAHYGDQFVYWGWTPDTVQPEALVLFKTGRTNANDGGIDYVMRPVGRFFQVTESLDVEKYFLDIEKIQRFPLTFVIKSMESPDALREQLRQQALRRYRVQAIVDRFMTAIEEILSIPFLMACSRALVEHGRIRDVLDEIVRQSRVEFNYEEAAEEDDDEPAPGDEV